MWVGLHRLNMNRLRQIAIFLLILAVLPWGAYSSARASHAAPDIGTVSAMAQAIPAEGAGAFSDQSPETKFAPMQKRCRTAALFGSPCGPQVTLTISIITFGIPLSGK